MEMHIFLSGTLWRQPAPAAGAQTAACLAFWNENIQLLPQQPSGVVAVWAQHSSWPGQAWAQWWSEHPPAGWSAAGKCSSYPFRNTSFSLAWQPSLPGGPIVPGQWCQG